MFDMLNSRRTFMRVTAAAALAIAVAAPIASAHAEQGNMDRALMSLQDALQSLRQATPNKGGHKEAASQLIEQAIMQVNEGIRFANQHGGGGR
ncbi:twin-arginine translocation signal domain-containing protein [Afipia clevelandensis]|nr:twin-arginine translocation signal domain-containing protein [Afipia clevelandensis]